jgi:putative transposase
MGGHPEQLTERGVLSAPDAAWEMAVQRATVIGRLAQADRVTVEAADAAAAELKISRRRVYALVRRWREGSGLVSDLIVGRSGGGRRW